MTKAEERRALLKEKSASMQRSTNVVNNKAQERRKMLGYAQTTPTPTVQSPTNNAFSMLNNATKTQSYNDVAKVNNTPALGYINVKEIAGPIAPSQELVKSTMQNKAYNEYARKLDLYDLANTSKEQQIEDKYSWGNWQGENGRLVNKLANTVTLGAISNYDKYKAEEENKKRFEAVAQEMYQDLLKNKEQRISEMGENNYYDLINRVTPLTARQGNVFEALGSDVEYGNLQVQSSLAWKDYIDSGKEEDKIKAEKLDAQLKKYMLEHPDVGKTIVSDTAQYLPQFGYQAKSNILPTIGSAATYAIANKATGNKQLAQKASQGVYAVGSTVTGSKASYDLAQGGIYRDLIQMGVPDEKAREISKDSAFWQTVIESGENLYNLKDIFGVSTNNPVKERVKDYLKAYGVNVLTEAGEEGTQELIGMAYEKKALDESGLDSSEYTMKNAINRAIQSAVAGGKIALTMGGGETAINITMNEIPNIQSRAEMQSSKNNIKKSIEQSFDNAIAEAKRKNNNDLVAKLQEQKQKSTTSEAINQAYETIKEFSENTQQPVQNIASQSPNNQIQQQTNEVIPQQSGNEQNANLVQNNTQITQNTPNNEQFSQNNVQNAQDLQKTVQNDANNNTLFKKGLEKFKKRDYTPEDDLVLLESAPEYFYNLGYDSKEKVVINMKKLEETMREPKGTFDDVNQHGITYDVVEQLPEAINNPLNIIKNPKFRDRFVLITSLTDQYGDIVIVPIEMNTKGRVIRVNTVYGKEFYDLKKAENIQSYMERNKDNIVYDIDNDIKKRSLTTNVHPGLQLPNVTDSSASINSIIPNSQNYVNNNFPTQAEQQQAQQELRNKLPTQEEQNGEKIAEILDDTEKSKTPFKELAKEAVNDFKRAFVDAGTDIAEIGKISNDKTLYHKFNSAKQSGQSANYMISEAQTNYQGDTVGKSLMDIFEPIRKKGQDYYKEFEYYMYHLHNIDRMQQGKPVFGKNVTADDSRNIVKEFEAKYPEFPKYAEDIRKWNANLQQYRIDTGLISQEQADIMNEMYPNYVPTYRETNGISGATKSGSIVKIVDTIKKATGSNKDILPLHEQMARQVMQTVQAGRRNVLGMQLYNDAIKNANKLGEYVQEIKTTKEDVETDADFDFEKQDLEGKFIVYDDGKKVEMQVSKGVLEGLKSLSSAKWESNRVAQFAKWVNSKFKKLVTEWNPGFLVKNAVRDIQDAGFYSENAKEFYKNYPQAWKEITSNGEVWQKYLAMGGSDASLFDFEQGYVVPKEGIPAKTIQKISEANFLVEQAPRFAEFLRIYNQSDKSYNALMEAMYGAADITVNFGRSGTWGKFINNNLVPFFNPAIQGTSKTLRTITGDGNVQGKKNFAKHMANIVGKGVLLGVAPTMINHILLEVFGGDDYDDLNERDKDIYFLIPTGDGKYFKLPKGRVLSVIGGFARRGLEYAKGNKDAYKGFDKFALEQTAPSNPFTNNIASPLVNTGFNITWYGTPIENESLQNYRPSQRYDEGTTEFAKKIAPFAEKINNKVDILVPDQLTSPKKIDYLLDAYGGAVADVTMPLMTKKAESSGLGKSFTLDSATSNRLSTDFYDTIEELTYDKNDDDQVAKMQLKYMNDVKEKAQDINKQIKDLHASDLDDKEKLKQVRELRKEVNTLQRDALNTYEKYGELANKYMNDDSVIELALRSTKEDSTEETKQQNIEKTVKLYTDKELFGSEYAMQEYDKRLVEKQKESNLEADTFFEIYFAQKGITGDKNTITGKTQSGSEKKKKLDAMHKAAPKLTPWELNKLYDLLN